jgi:hypothetical protein
MLALNFCLKHIYNNLITPRYFINFIEESILDFAQKTPIFAYPDTALYSSSDS